MQWSAVALIVCVTILTSHADANSVNSSPDRAAVHSGGQPVSKGVLTMLRDSMNQGDTAIKEQLKDSIANLKELLQGKDSYLDEQISEVLTQLKVRDDQLKENHAEDIARLRERLTKDLNYLNALLEEEEVRTKEELSKLKEALGKRPCGAQQSDKALEQQMADFQAELHSTKRQLQTTQTELKTHQEILQTARADLNTTRADLHTTRADLNTTRADLENIEETLQTQLRTAEQEIRSLKVEVDSVQSIEDLLSSEMGSIFTRWGRKTCPDNTSLVYWGYVGGQKWDQTGGGSNYLCLVRDPQLDNMTLPAFYSYVHGAEYGFIEGQHDQDAVCSVCRAPQVTTLMIPATLSCPPGWTTQYRGHLVSARFTHKGRTEFVCLDQVREHRDGGQADTRDGMFYHVITVCGALPCPPYVNNTVVTCVVCST